MTRETLRPSLVEEGGYHQEVVTMIPDLTLMGQRRETDTAMTRGISNCHSEYKLCIILATLYVLAASDGKIPTACLEIHLRF